MVIQNTKTYNNNVKFIIIEGNSKDIPSRSLQYEGIENKQMFSRIKGY